MQRTGVQYRLVRPPVNFQYLLSSTRDSSEGPAQLSAVPQALKAADPAAATSCRVPCHLLQRPDLLACCACRLCAILILMPSVPQHEPLLVSVQLLACSASGAASCGDAVRSC